ncbi:MAG: hypothetical protein ACRCZB_01450 [Bacteroidales bacterium]
MRAIFISLGSVFAITAFITHAWTTIIAFTNAGFLGGCLTFILPFLSEVYWVFKMLGENDAYAYTGLVHLILGILYSIFR